MPFDGTMKVGSLLLAALVVLVAGCTDKPLVEKNAEVQEEAPAEPQAVDVDPSAFDSKDPTTHVHPSLSRPLPQNLRWEAIAPMPLPRAEHCVANIGSTFHVIGGFLIPSVNDSPLVLPAGGGPIPSAMHEIYDATTDTWASGPDYPNTLDHAVCTEFGNEIYVFLGEENSYKYNPDSNAWIQIPGPANSHNAGVATVIGYNIYLTAGGSETVDIFDPGSGKWTTLDGEGKTIPTARGHTSGAAVHGKLYVAGGDVGGHSNNTAANEAFDPDAKVWSSKAPIPVVRGSTAGVYWLDRLVIMGGQSGDDGTEAYRNVDAYDPMIDSWTALPPMPSGRHGFGAGVWNNDIYVFGGAPKQGIYGFADSAVMRSG